MLRISMLWILLVVPLGQLFAESGAGSDSSLSNRSLVANGYARYSELGSDFYVGALFMRIPSSDPEVIRGVADKRMEFKILGGMSHRRFAQLLVKGSAINNKPQLLVENAKAMEAFLGGVKGNLNHGDHVVFAPTKGGLSLTVNSVELVAVEAPGLLNVLLNIWIGDVPPSRDFKSRMLGLTSPLEYQGDFDFLQYSPLRVSEIKSWKAAVADPAPKPTPERSLEREQNSVAREDSVAATGASASTAASGVARVAEGGGAASSNASARSSLEEERPAINLAASDTALLALAQSVGEKSVENVLESGAAKPATSQAISRPASGEERPIKVAKREASVSETLAPKALAPKTIAPETDSVAEEKAISAEEVLSEQFYANRLLLHSQQKMRYPTFSRRMGQEGTILVSVTIDRKGGLVDYVVTEASAYSPLNEAVERGIKQSEPFPQMPEKIPGDTFTFVVPVTFKLTSGHL